MDYNKIEQGLISSVSEDDPHKVSKQLQIKQWAHLYGDKLLRSSPPDELDFIVQVISDEDCWEEVKALKGVKLNRYEVGRKLLATTTVANMIEFISANNIFNQSLILCKKYYGINSAQVAFLLYNIGKTKILEGDLTIAEEYLNQSLAILQNKRHPKAYRVLESLIDLYKKRTIYEEQQGDIKQSQIYYTKAKYLINKLLSILKDNFPEDSSYIKKINLEHGEHSKAGAKLNLN